MSYQTQIKPSTQPAFFVPVYDSECDMSEAWNEVADPANEFDLEVTAYFAHSVNNGETIVDLIGVHVDDGHGPQGFTYKQACELVGADTMRRVEDAHQDALPDFDAAGARYDAARSERMGVAL